MNFQTALGSFLGQQAGCSSQQRRTRAGVAGGCAVSGTGAAWFAAGSWREDLSSLCLLLRVAELLWEPVLWAACRLSFGVPCKPAAGVAVLSHRCCIAVWSSPVREGTGNLFLAETCPCP